MKAALARGALAAFLAAGLATGLVAGPTPVAHAAPAPPATGSAKKTNASDASVTTAIAVDPLLLTTARKRLDDAIATRRLAQAEVTRLAASLPALQRAVTLAAGSSRTAAAEETRSRRAFALMANDLYQSASASISPAIANILTGKGDPVGAADATVLLNAAINAQVKNTSDAVAKSKSTRRRALDADAALSGARNRLSVATVARQRANTAVATAQADLAEQLRQAQIALAMKSTEQTVSSAGSVKAWRAYVNSLAAHHIDPPKAVDMRTGAKLPRGLRPLLDAAGKPRPGLATARITDHGKRSTILVLPREVIAAVGFAFDHLGDPYVFGAVGPTSFDCSGLTSTAYQHGGIAIPRIAAAQYHALPAVVAGQEAPGDMVFFTGSDGTRAEPGHVGMVIDPAAHLMIQAPQTGDVVKVSDYAGRSDLIGFGRPSLL